MAHAPSATSPGRFCDEVCKMPDEDPFFVRLVYYNADGKHTFSRRVPRSVDIERHQAELLTEGRQYHTDRQRRSLHLMHARSS